ISAMVYDRLAAGKPLLITRPANPAAEIDTSGYLSDCEWLTSDDAAGIVAIVDELSHGDAAQQRLKRWVEYYFGDTTPGAATRRFHGAVQQLMTEWEKNAALHAADGEIDDHDVKGDLDEADEIDV
ncbi:MAG TPA: hypothetical protein VIP54_00190, partial [Microterricola sp.]